jgi:hypothetical protein
MTTEAVEAIERQLPIAEIEEVFNDGGVHYVIRCTRADTEHYTIKCACGWFSHTGRSASGAHALMRSHVAGHRDRAAHSDL